jgi:hypothetical protein
MIKLGCGALTMLCLLAAAFLLWQSPEVPESLPVDLAEWATAWFALFRNPVAAAALFSLCVALAVMAASVTELLLGLLFSLLTAATSVLCLMGALGAQHPPFAESVKNFLQ